MAEKKELKSIADDIEALDDVLAGALTKFGALGKAGNKQWTVFARLASGSLLWKIQARLRAFMNLAELYTDGQKKQNKEMLESFKMQKKLADSTKNITAAYKAFKKARDAGYNTSDLQGTEVFDGMLAKYKDEKKAIDEGILFFKDAQKKATRAQAIADQGGHLKYYGNMAKEFLKKQPGKLAKATAPAMTTVKSLKSGQYLDKYKFSLKGAGGDFLDGLKTGKASKRAISMWKWAKETNHRDKLMEKWAKMNMIINKRGLYIDIAKEKMGKVKDKLAQGMAHLPKLIGLSIAGIGTFMMYGAGVLIGIILAVAIIKKAWPILSGMMTKLNKSLGISKMFFKGIWQMLYGVYDLIKAIWDGDVIGAFRAIFMEILPGLARIGTSILMGIGALLISLATSIIGGIVDGISHVLGGQPIIGGFFANGGITPGGPVVVGEKGPEIVSLPKGSRVHPNGTGPGGNNTIHIHINGRLGASDSEIRDIANKVAREINLRMNTRGTMTMGG
jgi:hypothetical protein